MPRTLYRCLMWVAQPLALLRVLWRSRAEPLYRCHLPERWGVYPPMRPKAPEAIRPLIWVHAVSLGETLASRPLLAALRQAYPGTTLLLTHWTATGRAAGASLLADHDQQAWAPWDTPGNVARFLTHFQPVMGLLMETEVWPEMVAACHARAIPLVSVNARMSERSLQRALRTGGKLARATFAQLTAALPQSEHDKHRLEQLGARCSPALGNLKFDHPVDPAQKTLGQQWRHGNTRPVVMLASTREGEEALWLQALQNAMEGATPQEVSALHAVQWLVVPRHPQRFDEVAQLILTKGWRVSRRSTWPSNAPTEAPGARPAFTPLNATTEDPSTPTVWLGDSLGEMGAYYTLADCALMGGTFLPTGGQNLIEACRYDCPVVLGPSTFNFAEAAQWALECGAAQSATDMTQAIAQAMAWVGQRTTLQAHRQAAQSFAATHSGATAKTMAELHKIVGHLFVPPGLPA